jgi:hypothetical protein
VRQKCGKEGGVVGADYGEDIVIKIFLFSLPFSYGCHLSFF